MTIDWNAFTPWASLSGGVIIGISAAMFVLLNGRIAGISGVLGGLLKPVRGDISWRAAFILGMIGAPLLYALFTELPRPQIDAGYAGLIVAGLLVGVGTASAPAAPAATACAAFPAYRRDPLSPRPPSWRPGSPPSMSCAT